MMKMVSFVKKALVFTTCLAVILVSVFGGSLKMQAAASLVVSGTVNGSSVNVTVAFPNVSFAAATVEVSFNPAHLELSSKATTAGLAHGMISVSEAANANAAGKCTFAIMDFTGNLSAQGGTLNLAFTIKDAAVETTPLTVTVVNCGDTSANPIELGGTSATLTLKTVTPPPPPPPPPPSSDESDSSVSSSVTDEGGDSDISDTPKPPVSSDTPKPPVSSVTSSTGPSDSETSDTGTVTDLPEVSDTESVLSSSESDAITDLPVTDTSDSALSQNSHTNTSSNPTSVPLGTQVVRTEGNGDGISTDTVVLLVSIAAACFLCFCLTYLGLRRQTPKNPEEE